MQKKVLNSIVLKKNHLEKITPFEFVIGKGLLIPGWELSFENEKGDKGAW